MWVEKLRDLSPIENELLFRKRNKQRGVDTALVDVDGTICDTRRVFGFHIAECAKYLEGQGGLSSEEWVEEIRAESDKLYKTHKVNPNRWNFGIENLAEAHDIRRQERGEVLDILRRIYETPIPYLPGAEEGLEFLKRTGLPIRLVTHAGHAWTRKKIEWLELGRFIDPENDVWTIDVNGDKTAEGWMKGIIYFGVRPRECMAIGDGPGPDILSAYDCGVENLFLVRREIELWAIHKRRTPDITRQIKSLVDLTYLGQEIMYGRTDK